MKFRVTMKDPDGPYEDIENAAKESIDRKSLEGDDEYEALLEKRKEKLHDFAKQWLEYGEYAYIEFDTEEGTARLLKADELK